MKAMTDQIQEIARLLCIQSNGDGLMSKIRQTIELLQEAAAERDQMRTELGDGTTGNKYRAELYDEVWQKARDMGFGNVTNALSTLAVQRAEQWSLRREAEAKVDTQAAVIAELREERDSFQRVGIRTMEQRDKLAGLLNECRGMVVREVERWTRASEILPVTARVESSLLQRIDAVLAEVKPCPESSNPAAT